MVGAKKREHGKGAFVRNGSHKDVEKARKLIWTARNTIWFLQQSKQFIYLRLYFIMFFNVLSV